MEPLIRVGLGYDLHRWEAGGPLILGGVEIPHERHLAGHSDADALLHAVTDAVLGAAGEGDIGELFPDTDPDNRGKDSSEMLGEAMSRVARRGWRVLNIDCVVQTQRPKLLPFREAIRTNLAKLLDVSLDRVWIKAKTGEGVGSIGREEALAVQCVVLLAQDA